MALGDGPAADAADQSGQPVLYTVQLGTQVISVQDNAADESQQAYDELVPRQYQPLADPITTDYLGRPRN